MVNLTDQEIETPYRNANVSIIELCGAVTIMKSTIKQSLAAKTKYVLS